MQNYRRIWNWSSWEKHIFQQNTRTWFSNDTLAAIKDSKARSGWRRKHTTSVQCAKQGMGLIVPSDGRGPEARDHRFNYLRGWSSTLKQLKPIANLKNNFLPPLLLFPPSSFSFFFYLDIYLSIWLGDFSEFTELCNYHHKLLFRTFLSHSTEITVPFSVIPHSLPQPQEIINLY